MNPGNLLEQFMGANAAQNMQQAGGAAKQKLNDMGAGGFTGGAVAGGILGLLLGGKKMRKMAGGMMSYGAAAGVGALALQAYQNWQQGKTVGNASTAAIPGMSQVDQKFLPATAPAADGQPFELALIKAMIAAAKADGHLDAEEQRRVFEKVEKLGLDAQSKGFIFDALTQPADLSIIAASTTGIEQASEIYLVSRLAIDLDHPAERAYLDALTHKLNLPAELVDHLNRQVMAGSSADGDS